MQKLAINGWIKSCFRGFVMFSLVLTGCGGTGGTNSLPTFNITGSWFIYTTETGTPGVVGPGIFTFTQSESNLSGATPLALSLSGSVNNVNVNFTWAGTDGYVNTYAGVINAKGTMAGKWLSTSGKSGIWSGIIEVVPTATVVNGDWNIFATTTGVLAVQWPILFRFTQSGNSIAGTG